jgi:Icc-related predicted phosphoesterase
MKILVVADLHYNLKQFDWLLEVAPAFDLVVIAGDLLDIAGHAELDAQIVVVAKYLERLRLLVPALVCSGNHDGDVKADGDEFIAEWLQDVREHNLHVDGDTVALVGGKATVCPWWDGPLTRAGVDRLLESAREPAAQRWIWIHHAPPEGSPVSWAGKQDGGDPYLPALLERLKPDLVFSGHIHQAPFLAQGGWCDRVGDTWVFNPGRELGARPAHLVVDLHAMEATWVSSMGVETIQLAEASPE